MEELTKKDKAILEILNSEVKREKYRNSSRQERDNAAIEIMGGTPPDANPSLYEEAKGLQYTGEGSPADDDLKALEEYIKVHGEMPEGDDLKSLGDWFDLSRNRNEHWEANMKKAGEFMMQESGQEIGPGDIDTRNQYYSGPEDMMTEGTQANALYQMALQQTQAQGQAQQQSLARSERGMQGDLAQNRQQLMDEIRGRRQKLLRSGLSSAQIANEEIQSIFMNQQQAAQTAQQYYNQRQQVDQQQQLAPYNAQQQVLEQLPGFQQTGAQYAASGAGDAYELTKKMQAETGGSFAKNWKTSTSLDN